MSEVHSLDGYGCDGVHTWDNAAFKFCNMISDRANSVEMDASFFLGTLVLRPHFFIDLPLTVSSLVFLGCCF